MRRALVLSAAVALLLPAGARASILNLSGQTFASSEGAQFSGQVGSFTRDDPASCYSGTIDWGDGASSALTLSAGTQVSLSGTHTYADEGPPPSGQYTFTVKVAESSGGGCAHPTALTASKQGTAKVGDAPLTASASNLDLADGAQFGGVVATFTDGNPSATAADFSASVDWGDGTATTGGTIGSSGGSFTVNAGHAYNGAGTYTITVTIADRGGSTATATGRASVGCPAATVPALPSGPDPAAGADPPTRFVNALYRDLLGRAPDAGAALWAGGLTGGTSRSAIVRSFLASSGFVSLNVRRVYQALLGRDPDPTQLSDAVTQIRGGFTPEQFEASLMGSDEYFQSQGGGSNTGFLCSAFLDLLARTASGGELTSARNSLDQGVPRTQYAIGLIFSPEALARRINELYSRYLGRTAGPAAQTRLIDKLRSGMQDGDLVASLVASPEYFHRVTGAGHYIASFSARGRALRFRLLHASRAGLLVVRIVGRAHPSLTAATGRARAASVPRIRRVGIAGLGRQRRGSRRVTWSGRVGGGPLARGSYALSLVVLSARGKILDQSEPVGFRAR